MTQENKQVRIVMRKVAPGALRAGLKRNIEKCEFQYAMSSRRMLELLSAGKVAETMRFWNGCKITSIFDT